MTDTMQNKPVPQQTPAANEPKPAQKQADQRGKDEEGKERQANEGGHQK